MLCGLNESPLREVEVHINRDAESSLRAALTLVERGGNELHVGVLIAWRAGIIGKWPYWYTEDLREKLKFD